MSNILKSLNEATHRRYDNNRTGFSRGPRDDERHDLDVQKPAREEWALKINGKVWSKDGKTVTFDSKERALKARQSLLAKRPELEVGLVSRKVSEGLLDDDTQTRMRMNDYYDLADAIQEKLRQAIQLGNKELIQKYSKERDDLDARVKQHGLMPESEQLDELSNEKLGQYKTAAALDAGKADKQGDYKRGNKRLSGIVKATKKQFSNDKKSAIGQGVGESAPADVNLPSKSFEELVKAKLAIERQREADIEAWKQDFQKNTAQKAQQQLARTFQPISVAQSGEEYSVLKDRLKQLNIAEPILKKISNLITAIKKEYPLVAEKMDNIDSQLLQQVKDGAADNYQSLMNSLKQLDTGLPNIYPRAYIRLTKLKQNNPAPTPSAYSQQKGGVIFTDQDKGVDEGWSQKYKSSINCSHPKGFSQKAHCAGKKKHNESIDNVMEMTCPDCGMCETHVDHENLDEACWKGYHKEGNKELFGKTVPNCVKNEGEEVDEADMNRRGFLKGMGAAAVAGAAGGAVAQSPEEFEQAQRNTWAQRVGNRIKANTTFNLDNLEGNPQTVVEIRIATNGTILSRKILSSSGNKAWDEAVLRAIDKTATVPLDSEGKIPSTLIRFSHRPNSVPQQNAEPKESVNQGVAEEQHSCPHCGGEMVSEELMNEKKDACYYKVKSRYKVWPSAYASGALVKCRNKGASNWGNGGKKNESSILEGIEQADESLHDWFNKEKWVRMDTKGNIKGPCAKEPGEGKPKCLPQSKAHSLGKKGRASAAQRKRREDPNPDRSGKAINVNTKKSKG